MASESTEDGSLVVTLPADLGEWLDDRAGKLGVDREAVLVQLLAAYRGAAELDDDLGGPLPVADAEVVADAVESELEGRVTPAVESALAETLDDDVADAVEAEVDEVTGATRRDIEGRIDAVEADYTEKIEDLRDRVVQVKKETDAKAPGDHSHPELDRLDGLVDDLDDLSARLDGVEERLAAVDGTVAEHDESVEDLDGVVRDLDETVAEVQNRLRSVAWAVTDLRESFESDESNPVESIRRAAARADVDRAACGRCGDGVDVALLTDPECPHCQATVTDVQPGEGFFSKPRLVVASQLESGESQ